MVVNIVLYAIKKVKRANGLRQVRFFIEYTPRTFLFPLSTPLRSAKIAFLSALCLVFTFVLRIFIKTQCRKFGVFRKNVEKSVSLFLSL